MVSDPLRLLLASLDKTMTGLPRGQDRYRERLAALADDIRTMFPAAQPRTGEGHFAGTQAWAAFPWIFFREGIDIVPLSSPGETETSAALLRYRPGASAPRHMHMGAENIVILSGSQQDERGRYARGTTLCNPEGSSHSVVSPEGCVVGIVWDRPVRFLADEPATPSGPGSPTRS